MAYFLKWLEEGFCTPHGNVFDIGDATMESIINFKRGVSPLECGGTQVWQNGNGALMRMLPLSIFIKNESSNDIHILTSQCSSLTHRHIRSQLSCTFYSFLVKYLLEGYSFETSYEKSIADFRPLIPKEEIKEFSRILDKSIIRCERISSTGYVIHSLEASIYCLSSTNNFKNAVLKAVNLGFDSDTTAAITGGLAGLMYGYDSIPEEWLDVIVRKDFISKVINDFIDRLA